MSTIKISQLTPVTPPVLAGSVLPVVQNGVTVKTTVSQLRPTVSVTDYGAKGDGIDLYACSIGQGSDVFQAAVPVFKPSDLGKVMVVRNVQSGGVDLITTVAEYLTEATVRLSHLCTGNGGTNVTAHFGTNDLPAIMAALQAASQQRKALRWDGSEGYYLTAAAPGMDRVVIPANVSVYGDGPAATVVKSAIRNRQTIMTGSYWNGNTIRDIAVSHCCSLGDNIGGNGFQLGELSSQSVVENVHAYGNERGFVTPGNANAFIIDKCYSSSNVNDGYYFQNPNFIISNSFALQNGGGGAMWIATTNGAGSTISNFVSYGNAHVGMRFQGSPTSQINDVYITNCISSSDVCGGIVFDTYGKNHLINNCFAEASGFLPGTTTLSQPGAHGFQFTANNLDIHGTNNQAFENASHGVGAGCPVTWIGGKIDGNGRGGSGYGFASTNNSGQSLLMGVRFGPNANASGAIWKQPNFGQVIGCIGV